MLDFDDLHAGPRRFLEAQRKRLSELRFEHLTARPLAPTIGAEISGVDLSGLDDAAAAELERAFVEFKVLFFRDQDLSIEAHLALARRFGELEEHPFLPAKDGHGQVIRFAKDEATVGVENIWHSDVSWREIPSLGSVLHALEVPAVGGDTLWADMEAAYDGLDDETRQRIGGLRAVHDFTHSFGRLLPPDELEKKRREFPAVEHPVVRTHPVTGRKSIYVNRIFTSHIVGLSEAESDALLERLCRQAQVPEYQCRFRWQKHSIAFWDNRAVQHYACSDYWPQGRVMERVTIIGDRPR